MTYFICIIVVCISGYVGRLIAKTFVVRDKFYKELMTICVYFKNEISFKQVKIDKLFDEYISVYKSDFRKQIECMKSVVKNNSMLDNKLFYFLKTEEKKMIVNFLNALGKGDKDVEISQIESFNEYVNKKVKESEESRKKNEGLSYKISLAVGVVISILLI